MTQALVAREPTLAVLDALPAGFSDVTPAGLEALLGGPTLIHLEGRREPALFVAILLHGNEGTGLRAVQRVLARYEGRRLPRGLSIFVGNVAAAARGVRRLDGQPDYNRIWPGAPDAVSPEHLLAARVTAAIRERGMFASIDIHNNTGTNPLYGCITRLDHASLQLAALFGRTVVVFETPRGVQTAAFAAIGPSITIECGKPESEPGVTRAADFVDACLRLDHFPEHPLPAHEIDVFRTVAVVKVPDDVAFGFGDVAACLAFPADLDRMNFRELAPGTCLATMRPGARLDVRDDAAQDVFDRYFEVPAERLLTRCAIMPAMLTRDATIVRQDCLCYLMERIDPFVSRAAGPERRLGGPRSPG